jgi:nucleotide-binding universal stress UspA family protein
MNVERVLVAIDDSPSGLAAARVAVELAGGWGAALRAVTVLHDHTLAAAIGGEGETAAAEVTERLGAGTESLLAWVADLAARHGVHCRTAVLAGEPFRRILDESRDWDADLVVMGRSDRRGLSSPYLGSEVAQVLEFTDRPVLVVPASEPAWPVRGS